MFSLPIEIEKPQAIFNIWSLEFWTHWTLNPQQSRNISWKVCQDNAESGAVTNKRMSRGRGVCVNWSR